MSLGNGHEVGGLPSEQPNRGELPDIDYEVNESGLPDSLEFVSNARLRPELSFMGVEGSVVVENRKGKVRRFYNPDGRALMFYSRNHMGTRVRAIEGHIVVSGSADEDNRAMRLSDLQGSEQFISGRSENGGRDFRAGAAYWGVRPEPFISFKGINNGQVEPIFGVFRERAEVPTPNGESNNVKATGRIRRLGHSIVDIGVDKLEMLAERATSSD